MRLNLNVVFTDVFYVVESRKRVGCDTRELQVQKCKLTSCFLASILRLSIACNISMLTHWAKVAAAK